jgi:Na+/H+-translocating membrane pyrophosphatase
MLFNIRVEFLAIGIAVLALLFALVLALRVRASAAGSRQMEEIAKASVSTA